MSQSTGFNKVRIQTNGLPGDCLSMGVCLSVCVWGFFLLKRGVEFAVCVYCRYWRLVLHCIDTGYLNTLSQASSEP